MNKNRNLSTYEYLQVLQVEYVVSELRRKIYVKAKDKRYYDRVMQGKKDKIDDICLRNNLPSIFTDSETKLECYSKVYSSWGYPDFHYKNDDQLNEFKAKDFYYYYYKNSDFKVMKDDSTAVGKIMSVNQELSVAHVRVKGEQEDRVVSLNHISRII